MPTNGQNNFPWISLVKRIIDHCAGLRLAHAFKCAFYIIMSFMVILFGQLPILSNTVRNILTSVGTVGVIWGLGVFGYKLLDHSR